MKIGELVREHVGDGAGAARALVGGRVLELEHLLHEAGRQPGLHEARDPGDPRDVLLVVRAIPVRLPGRGQQFLLLVVAHEPW